MSTQTIFGPGPEELKAADAAADAAAAEKAKNNAIKKRHAATKLNAANLADQKAAKLAERDAATQESLAESTAIAKQAETEASLAEAEYEKAASAAFTKKVTAAATAAKPFAIGGVILAGVVGAIFMFRR